MKNKSEIENILAPLRQRLNKIDDTMLSLLEERISIVSQVSKEKHALNMPTSFPGREASMLKTLRDKTQAYSKNAVVKIWRENMGASMKIEGNYSVGTLKDNINNHITLARDHYGVESPLNNNFNTFDELFSALENNNVTVIVVPLDTNNNPTDTKWIALLDEHKHFICATLPFAYELPELAGSRSVIITKPLPETDIGTEKAVLISLDNIEEKHKLTKFKILSSHNNHYLINTHTDNELHHLQHTFPTLKIMGSFHKSPFEES